MLGDAQLDQRGIDGQRLAGLALVHAVATSVMVGLIWTVHVVHYPLFELVGADTYVDFQAEHVERIGLVLALPWTVEGVCTLLLLAARPRLVRRLALAGAIAMAGILVLTVGWSAPSHEALADGFDAAAFDRLMVANLLRTLLWTVRGVIAAWIAWEVLVRPLSGRDASR